MASKSPLRDMATKNLHIAIIPDGNRRWAKTRTLFPWKGHERAIENFRTLSDWCRTHERIGTLTVWCFSTENWKRDADEVAHLMQLLEDYLRRDHREFHAKRTRVAHSGRRDRLPASLVEILIQLEQETQEYHEFTLHLCIDYGGQDEIVRAVQKAGQQADSIEHIRQYLDHPELPDIDLIIRTSGEQRTSNFCLWQSTYAEWTFSPKLFPDFGPSDVATALSDFDRRQRRFGGS